jgi:DNA-directed RNA polymerase subunit D
MEIKVLEKDGQRMRFLVEGIKPSLAGALRRIMISEIPAMSIEWVDFMKNDSAMIDELLANRLGQIPLTYDTKSYKQIEDCKCDGKGCSRCQVKLGLKKKGPAVVYSDDLKSNDKSVKPSVEKIPIVELFEGEELQFNAIAQLGVGRDHVKWQGAAVGYINLPRIRISDISKGDLEKFANSCPRNVFKISGGKLTVTDVTECNMCEQCVELSDKGEVEVTPIEDSLIFDVESVCGLPVEDVVAMSADILAGKMKDFQKALKKLK